MKGKKFMKPIFSKVLFMILLFAVVAGCGNQNDPEEVTSSTSHSLAEETLLRDPSADFFIFNDRVYVRNEELTNRQDKLGEALGEIESNYIAEKEFKNLMSTKLPIGTKIYRIEGEVSLDRVLVKLDNMFAIYVALVEG